MPSRLADIKQVVGVVTNGYLPIVVLMLLSLVLRRGLLHVRE